MTKIAIIYTGEIRTCETTLPFFKKNVLLNDDYHVFSVVQTTYNNDYYTNLIKENIQDNLKSLIFFDNNNDWVQIKTNLLNEMVLNEYWKYYLSNSGSMIEYYQMYLAYKNIQEYENIHDFKYDFVLRYRTDTVLKDIINFDLSRYNTEYIKQLFYKIPNHSKIISKESLFYFMNIVFNEKRIDYNDMYLNNNVNTDQLNNLLSIQDEDEFFREVENYIKNGDYMISLRKNVIYFMKRSLMDKVHVLGITYGKYISSNNNYWFNSESQLEEICCQNKIDTFSSTSTLEELSLYSYNHVNYFDENNQLLDDKYSFFIKRY